MKQKVAVALLGLLYVLFPWDFIPDMIFGLGWLDDSVMLLLLWRAYQYMAHRRQAGRAGATGDEQPFEGDAETGYGKPRPGGVDPYEVLEVEPGASRDEIRRAYRRLANKYHPDKVQHLGEEFRELAESRFKEIQAAYRKLSD